MSSYATPPMLLNLDLATGFVYGAFSLPICICMWLFIPETKGYVEPLLISQKHLLTERRRSTGEIDELYERKIPAWRWGRTVTAIEEQMQAAVRARPAGEVLDNEKA
jgi:SP family general alpha glucoside:H+ symporter-like MFS transporter